MPFAYPAPVARMRAFVGRLVRAMTLLARDARVPKPLRVVAGVALLPIPGPIDEVVLVLVAPVFLAFYRGPMREAWAAAAPPDQSQPIPSPSPSR